MPNKITRPTNYFPSITIYSRAKTGKTKFLTTAGQGKILILDAQHGTDWMTHPKLQPDVWHIEKWSDWEDAYQFLRHEKHNYIWAGNDTLTKLHNLSLRMVINAEGDKPLPSGISLPKRGLAGEHVKMMIDKFRRLPMGVIFTANERVITTKPDGDRSILDSEELDSAGLDESNGDIRFVPDLPDDVRKHLVAETDIIGRLYVMPPSEMHPRGERRLWVAHHNDYDTGYRSQYQLPSYISGKNGASMGQLMAHLRKDTDNG